MLIKGAPGTGKSTLALQMALTALLARDRSKQPEESDSETSRPKCIYYSCEQTREDIERSAQERRFVETHVQTILDAADEPHTGLEYLSTCKAYEIIQSIKQFITHCVYQERGRYEYPKTVQPTASRLDGRDSCAAIQGRGEIPEQERQERAIEGQIYANIDHCIADEIQRRTLLEESFVTEDTASRDADDLRQRVAAGVRQRFHEDIRSVVAQIVKNLSELECVSYLAQDADRDAQDECEPYRSSYELYNWLDCIIARIGKAEPPPALITVVDGMNLLYKDEQEKVQMHRLMDNLRQSSLLGIVILDTGCDGPPFQEFMADIVIEMKSASDNAADYSLQKLSISKARHQETVRGWHQYRNGKEGIVVYPSLHYWADHSGSLQEQMRRSMMTLRAQKRLAELGVQKAAASPIRGEKASSGGRPNNDEQADLITQMIDPKTFKRGSCTVLLGSTRTLKEELCLDFLRGHAQSRSEAERHGTALLVTLDSEENVPEQCKRMCDRFGAERGGNKNRGFFRKVTLRACDNCDNCEKDPACTLCFNKVHSHFVGPGCITPGEFMYRLNALYRKLRFTRLVFWDLTQIETRFPLLAADGLFLPLLIDWLQNSKMWNPDIQDFEPKRITSLFAGETNTKIGKTASTIADNVLYTWRDQGPSDSQGQDRRLATGVAVYLDRAQGRSTAGTLWWLQDAQPADADASASGESALLRDCKKERSQLVRASQAIDRIKAMHGFHISSSDHKDHIRP
jgi:hypothetical protein